MSKSKFAGELMGGVFRQKDSEKPLFLGKVKMNAKELRRYLEDLGNTELYLCVTTPKTKKENGPHLVVYLNHKEEESDDALAGI